MKFLLKRKQTGDKNTLSVDITHHKEAIWKIVKKCIKHHNDYLLLDILTPRRLRTTGPESQCNCLNGWIQFFCVETGNDFHQVKMYVKEKAMSRGYPPATDENGNVIVNIYGNTLPQSEAHASVEEAKLLIEEIEQLAAEYDIRLPQRDMFKNDKTDESHICDECGQIIDGNGCPNCKGLGLF